MDIDKECFFCYNKVMFIEAKQKLDKMLCQKFAIFANTIFSSNLFVFGGAIRDAILSNEIKDLDLFILTENKSEVLDFVKKNNFQYTLNSFGNPKINYSGINIDFCPIKNFSEVVFFNSDGLFYNVSTGKFIVTKEFNNFIKTKNVEVVNRKEVHPNPKRILERKLKVENFARFIFSDKNIQILESEMQNTSLFERGTNQEFESEINHIKEF